MNRRSFVAVLFTFVRVPAVRWEIRTAGSDTNGGGFDLPGSQILNELGVDDPWSVLNDLYPLVEAS